MTGSDYDKRGDILNRFGDFFQKYADITKIKKNINNSEIRNVQIDDKKRSLVIEAECSELIPRADIFAAEDVIRSSILELSSCTFSPHYDSELFDTDYYP